MSDISTIRVYACREFQKVWSHSKSSHFSGNQLRLKAPAIKSWSSYKDAVFGPSCSAVIPPHISNAVTNWARDVAEAVMDTHTLPMSAILAHAAVSSTWLLNWIMTSRQPSTLLMRSCVSAWSSWCRSRRLKRWTTKTTETDNSQLTPAVTLSITLQSLDNVRMYLETVHEQFYSLLARRFMWLAAAVGSEDAEWLLWAKAINKN